MNNETSYEKNVKSRKTVYSVKWSDYIAVTKFNVVKKFTEMTGIYIVFYLNKYKRLAPLVGGIAWYTGFRPSLLRLYSADYVDRLPKRVLEKVEDEKIVVKFVEIHKLEDLREIFFTLMAKYPDIYVDTNGIPPIEDLSKIKVIDSNTKIYYKKKQNIDI